MSSAGCTPHMSNGGAVIKSAEESRQLVNKSLVSRVVMEQLVTTRAQGENLHTCCSTCPTKFYPLGEHAEAVMLRYHVGHGR